jgi:hypothetical protein
MGSGDLTAFQDEEQRAAERTLLELIFDGEKETASIAASVSQTILRSKAFELAARMVARHGKCCMDGVAVSFCR